MTVIDQDLMDFAVRITREAGALTLQWFQSDTLDIESKNDGTPVTIADKSAERFLREAILERFPDDTIIGEEEASQHGSSTRTWIIDPIDGTKAFTHGVPLYTNLLALNDEHGPAIGVINMPGLHETVYAGRGLGCFCNGKPAKVSSSTSLSTSYISTCGYEKWPIELLTNIKDTGAYMRTWGDGYGYALVATGRIDAMIDPEVAIWDVAPMPVILQEAGGKFTDFTGAVCSDGGNGFATNGHLHDQVLQIIQNS